MSQGEDHVRVIHPPHGGAIPVTVEGPDHEPARTPLVLVPGVGGPRGMFHHQIREFRADRTVVATNLNAATARGLDPIESAAGDVLHVMDELGMESVDLLGASFGSTVVARVAARAPSRVRRLLWIAPPVVRHGPWRRAFGPGWLVGGAMLKYASPAQRAPIARFLATRKLYSPEPDLDEAELVLMAGRVSDTQLRPFFSRLAALGAWDWRRFDALHPHPLLVLQGAREHALTPPDAVRAWERASGRPVLVIPGHHMPYLSYPELFNSALRTFLDDVSIPPPTD